MLASIEPYDPGSGVLEWFAVSDLYRAWDDRVDVRAGPPAAPIQPSLPLTRPLRIRPLDGSGATPLYDDTVTFHEGMSDADGGGVAASRR